jgi:hypothetical protein
MPGHYSHTTRPPYAILYASVYNADHQNHIDHLEPQYIDRDGTTLADMQAVSDPGNDGSEVQPTTLRDEIRQLRNEIKVLKSYIAQTAPANWYSKLASTNRAFLPRDGTLQMTGPLKAKSGAGDVNNPNNSGIVFDNDIDTGFFSSAAGIIDLHLDGVSFLQAHSAQNLLKLSRPIQFPATQYSSTDPNALDDYEEGNWTPTLSRTPTAPSLTYTTQIGRYIKIGRLVFATAHITVNTVSSQGSGEVIVQGFPFAVDTNCWGASPVFYSWNSYSTAYGNATLGIKVNSTGIITLNPLINNAPSLSTVNLDNSMMIKFLLTYATFY